MYNHIPKQDFTNLFNIEPNQQSDIEKEGSRMSDTPKFIGLLPPRYKDAASNHLRNKRYDRLQILMNIKILPTAAKEAYRVWLIQSDDPATRLLDEIGVSKSTPEPDLHVHQTEYSSPFNEQVMRSSKSKEANVFDSNPYVFLKEMVGKDREIAQSYLNDGRFVDLDFFMRSSSAHSIYKKWKHRRHAASKVHKETNGGGGASWNRESSFASRDKSTERSTHDDAVRWSHSPFSAGAAASSSNSNRTVNESWRHSSDINTRTHGRCNDLYTFAPPTTYEFNYSMHTTNNMPKSNAPPWTFFTHNRDPPFSTNYSSGISSVDQYQRNSIRPEFPRKDDQDDVQIVNDHHSKPSFFENSGHFRVENAYREQNWTDVQPKGFTFEDDSSMPHSIHQAEAASFPQPAPPVENIPLPPKPLTSESNCTNILVMGETGVGKSTFINGLVNYLKYNSMQEALDGGVEVLIDSAFTLTDDQFKSHRISCNSTITAESNPDSNENTVAGQSATQDPKSYVFSCGSAGEEKKIRLIDTPGIGDTRGPQQDKINFDKILSFISKYGSLHAICILIRPNTARLTLAFRFCIDELLVHLHKSASKNILFCFTNTRGTLYKPGDTLPTLRHHLQNLKDKMNVDIPINKSTVFCFDNESFRFLCALKHGFPFTETDVANFAASWKQSVQETEKLLARISQLPAHAVRETTSLNSTRNLIISLARPLGDLIKTQCINLQMIKENSQQLARNRVAGRDLEHLLCVDKTVLRPVTLAEPQTVCTSSSCVENVRISPESAVTQTVYKTVCHNNCCLSAIQTMTVPNEELRRCQAMRKFDGFCEVCGCSWDKHMHIKYRLDPHVIKVHDPAVAESIQRRESSAITLDRFVESRKKMRQKLFEEANVLIECCAEFAVFMQQNSIVQYFDTFGQYLTHIIKEESAKVSMGGNWQLMSRLQTIRDSYNGKIRSLKSDISAGLRAKKTFHEIEALINQLGQLSSCGPVVKAIREMNGNVADQDTDEGHVVEVGGSLLGSAVSKILSAIGLQ